MPKVMIIINVNVATHLSLSPMAIMLLSHVSFLPVLHLDETNFHQPVTAVPHRPIYASKPYLNEGWGNFKLDRNGPIVIKSSDWYLGFGHQVVQPPAMTLLGF